MNYRSIRLALCHIIVLAHFMCGSQNVLIRGKAHGSYAGQTIELYTFRDYISGLRIKENQDTIASDGFFELALQTEITQPVILKINNVTARLYVQPDFVYGITIPELDETLNFNRDVELPVNIGIVGRDSTELNALIFDYEDEYNKIFASSQEKFPSRTMMFRRCDSLQKLCDKKYAGIKNDYFKNYVRYNIAGVNASLSRGERFLISQYITGKPVQYDHEAYMLFFKSTFRGYLAHIASQRKGQSLYNIINSRSDYDALLNFVRYEKELRSDSIRELIIISELWDYYFSKDFDPEAVAKILTQLNQTTTNAMHRTISSGMLAFINKLQVGSAAPPFQVIARDGTLLDWSSYKGKWVYLNFFSTSNTGSLKEMPKIAELKKKFGGKMVFLSVCLDDSLSTYNDYLKSNPKFDWLICFDNRKDPRRSAKSAYAIVGTEGYFLISNFGLIAAAPALAPSQGIEYRLNLIFKVRQRNTKTGIR